MKKTKLLIITLVMAIIMTMPTLTAAQSLGDVPQRTEDGVVYVALRLAAYAHGASVEWNEAARAVYITLSDGNAVSVVIDAAGGFIEDGKSWIPYEYARQLFDSVPIEVSEGGGIHGAIHRVEYGYNVAYLFGTLHGGHDHWFPLADVVEDAIRRSDVVAVEVEEVAGETAAMDAALMGAMFLPDGMTWVEFLPEYAYNHIVEMMVAWEIPYEEANTMNPWFLAFSLEMELVSALSALDVSRDASVDAYVAAVAAELGLPIIGLESIEQQMELLFSPPLEVKVAGIKRLMPLNEMAIALLTSVEMTLDQMAYYYENNNLYALAHGWALEMRNDIEAGCVMAAYSRDIIANWRSTYYANEIARLLRETEEPTTFFVAVGLSHIIRSWGGEGFTDIVQQLQLLEFEVVPIF